MTTSRASLVLQHVRELVPAEGADRLSDRELLERYHAGREPAAFEALLRRYGPLVLGVCRRVLANRADAEDAFQATFLVLAQKAGSIRKHTALGSWLYGVAYRVAAKARLRSALRQRYESRADRPASADPLEEVTGRELVSLLDEELHGLSERHRAPLVLCYLQGKTRDEAAALLGWSQSMLQRRLERARELLRARLARRGLGLPAVLLAAGLSHVTAAALPSRLAAATLRTVAEGLPGARGAGAVSGAAGLAGSVLGSAPATRLGLAAAILLACGTLALGIAGAASARSQREPTGPAQKSMPADRPGMAKVAAPAGGPAGKEEGKEVVVTGRVLDATGKTGLQADVILVRTAKPRLDWEEVRHEILARGRTDKDGNYRLAASTSRAGFEVLHVLAQVKGRGLGWRPITRGPGPLRVNLLLRPEQPLALTLIDLQGQPAAGVKVRLHSLSERGGELTGRMMAGGTRLMDARTLDGYVVRWLEMWDLFFPYGAVKGLPFGPPAVATADRQGRVVLRGLGEEHVVRLLVEDERFAVQELRLRTGKGGAPKPLTLPLAPARWLEGRVVCEATGKPLPGATLVARTSRTRDLGMRQLIDLQVQQAYEAPALDRTEARADGQGRYRLNLPPGDTVSLHALPPDGAPNLGIRKRLALPPGVVKQALEVRLPRGVEVRGRVTEQTSGAGIARAELYYLPLRENNPRPRRDLLVGENYRVQSGPDGAYRLIVPPEPGHVIVADAGPGMVEPPIGRGELFTGKPTHGRYFDGRSSGERVYAHAFRALDPKPGTLRLELPLTVLRGVTLRGRVVGPDGKPVPRAVLFCGGDLLRAQPGALRTSYLDGDLGRAVPLEGGRFELRGCDPKKTYRLYFLDDPTRGGEDRRKAFANEVLRSRGPRLGAAVRLSPAEAGGRAVTVRLQPCGAVEFRIQDPRGRPLKRIPETPGSWKDQFVDADGKRLGQQPYVDLLVEPKEGGLGEERMFLGFPFRQAGYEPPFTPDKDGFVRLHGLIPGASYRLQVVDEDACTGDGRPPTWDREIRVGAGQTRRLPDLVLPLSPARDR
jgi:RNA polymerase sigma factor (sigma-70 family)